MLLYTLHIAAFIIHFVSFLLSLFTHISEADVDVLITKHIYEQNKFSITTTQSISSINANAWVSINEALTCFSHAFALYLLYGKKECKEVNNLEHGRRTIEYGFTAGILAVALVANVGAVYLQDIIFLLGINVVIQGLGWIIHYEDDKNEINFMYMGAFLLLILEIAYVFIQTLNIDSPDQFDMIFYQIMGIIFGVLYISFGLVKFLVKNRDIQDEMYVIMSVTTKVVLSWIIISNTHQGFMDLFDSATVPADVIEIDWRSIQLALTIILLVGMAAGLVYVFTRERDCKYEEVKEAPRNVITIPVKLKRHDL